jgi:hypothetical protein
LNKHAQPTPWSLCDALLSFVETVYRAWMHKTVRLKNKVQGDIDCGPDLQVLILLSEMRAIFNRARQVRGQSKNLTSPSRTVENYEKDSPQRPTTSQAGAKREAHRVQELIRLTGRNMSA